MNLDDIRRGDLVVYKHFGLGQQKGIVTSVNSYYCIVNFNLGNGVSRASHVVRKNIIVYYTRRKNPEMFL